MIYADTSAIVKLVIWEEESRALEEWLLGNPHRAITSVITQIELKRAVIRRNPESVEKMERVLRNFDLMALTPGIVRLAGALQPSTLRTLDAIHLATILSLGHELNVLLSYDDRLNLAANMAGFDSVAPK